MLKKRIDSPSGAVTSQGAVRRRRHGSPPYSMRLVVLLAAVYASLATSDPPGPSGATLEMALSLLDAQGQMIRELQAAVRAAAAASPPPPAGLFVVTDFGADPTGKTDSTMAIQYAFWNATAQMAR